MADNLHDTGFLLKNLMENMTDNIYFKDADKVVEKLKKSVIESTQQEYEYNIAYIKSQYASRIHELGILDAILKHREESGAFKAKVIKQVQAAKDIETLRTIPINQWPVFDTPQ